MERENTFENMEKRDISITTIDEKDRSGDGNLLPKARDRTREMIEKRIRTTGRINVSELSRLLGLSRPTIRSIADEILTEWHADISDQTVVVHKWCEHVAREIDVHPGQFDKDTIARLRLKMSLFDKMRVMRKAMKKGDP